MEALNIASSATWDVDTDSLEPLTACEPLSPSYNVEAIRVTLLPRPKIWQVQHCIGGVGAADTFSNFSRLCNLFVRFALGILRASTVPAC